MIRMTVTLDEDVVEEARQLFGVRTKSQAIRRDLEQAVHQGKLDRVLEHAGRIDLDIDQERLRRLRETAYQRSRGG